MSDATKPVTELLAAVGGGDASAQEKLWTLIYDELRGVAHNQLRGQPPGRTLQTTMLVHEAYVRLVGCDDIEWANRRHFFATAAKAMRSIRIDDVRRRGRQKRGGASRDQQEADDAGARRPSADVKRVSLEALGSEPVVFDDDPVELLALDETLTKLEQLDPFKAELVMLRYFAGLTVDEAAHALDVSPRLVDKEWRFARLWLHRELRDH